MLDTIVRSPRVRNRLLTGPAGPFLELLSLALLEQQYPTSTIGTYLKSTDRFCRWIRDAGLAVELADAVTLAVYVASLRRAGRTSNGPSRTPKPSVGLSHFIALLDSNGCREPIAPARESTPSDRLLAEYERHMVDVQGLAPATRSEYLRFASRFIDVIFGDGPLDWERLTARDLAAYFTREVSSRRGHGRKWPGNGVRAFLRFVAGRHEICEGLLAAIPKIRNWKLAALPRYLSEDDVEKLLSVCDDKSPAGIRNRAIVLVLARLGLRAHEVTGLQLCDLEWSDGIIVVAPGKTRRERRLPMTVDVGEALSRYLKDGRPRCAHRHVFTRATPPFSALATASAVSSIVKRLAGRAGVTLPPGVASHALRHSAATQMVRRGASFKDVADVLGHRMLQTTAHYAKLDLDALVRVALPWPGGSK